MSNDEALDNILNDADVTAPPKTTEERKAFHAMLVRLEIQDVRYALIILAARMIVAKRRPCSLLRQVDSGALLAVAFLPPELSNDQALRRITHLCRPYSLAQGHRRAKVR